MLQFIVCNSHNKYMKYKDYSWIMRIAKMDITK